MEGWVDLGDPATERLRVELATSRSQVRRSNHYATEPPSRLRRHITDSGTRRFCVRCAPLKINKSQINARACVFIAVALTEHWFLHYQIVSIVHIVLLSPFHCVHKYLVWTNSAPPRIFWILVSPSKLMGPSYMHRLRPDLLLYIAHFCGTSEEYQRLLVSACSQYCVSG